MTDTTSAEARQDSLWRGVGEAKVYALLDGAAEVTLAARLFESRLPQRCLFNADLPPELAATAPYVVQLEAGHALTEWLLDRGWGEAWGLYVQSSESLKELWRHFRRLLKVRLEDGREVFFRFYDPRILSAYLPTCTAEERAFVFGPVERFSTECARSGAWVHHARDVDPVVRALAARLPSRAAAEPAWGVALDGAAELLGPGEWGSLWSRAGDDERRALRLLRAALHGSPDSALLQEVRRRARPADVEAARALVSGWLALLPQPDEGRLGATLEGAPSLAGDAAFAALCVALPEGAGPEARAALVRPLLRLARRQRLRDELERLLQATGDERRSPERLLEQVRAALERQAAALEPFPAEAEVVRTRLRRLEGRAPSASSIRAGLLSIQTSLRLRRERGDAGQLAGLAEAALEALAVAP